jgi:hypothetical protein
VNQIVALGARPEAEQRSFDYELTGRIFLAGRWGGIDFEQRGSTAELRRGAAPGAR